MNGCDLAQAMQEAEWRKVLRDAHARCLRRRELALRRRLEIDAAKLGRDGVAAIQMQITAIEEQISRTALNQISSEAPSAEQDAARTTAR